MPNCRNGDAQPLGQCRNSADFFLNHTLSGNQAAVWGLDTISQIWVTDQRLERLLAGGSV